MNELEPLSSALRRERWMRIACALWLALWALFVLKGVFQPDRRGVYPIFAAASQHWWLGMPMYVRYEGLDIFRYSPTFAVAFSAFGLLPEPWGSALFNLVSLSVLFAGLRMLVHRVFPWSFDLRQEGIFLFLALAGTVRGVWSAQSNALLLGLALFGTAAALERRWWTAAILLTAPAFIKIWPIALLLLLACYWPRQLIPRALAAGAGLAFLPFLTRSWTEVVAEYRGFYAILVATNPVRWPGYRDAWTILEQVVRVDPTLYDALRAAGVVVVLAFCLHQRRRLPAGTHLATATLSAWTTWQLLLGPGTERLTYGLIAPFTSAAVLVAGMAGRLRRTALTAWWLTAILGAGGVERALQPFFPAAPAIQPAGVVVFAVWIALWDWSWPQRFGAT